MKWENLKENKCPECGKPLDWDAQGKLFCPVRGCGFAINQQRFAEIVASQVNAGLEAEREERE